MRCRKKKEKCNAVPEPAPENANHPQKKEASKETKTQDNNTVNARSLMHRVNAQMKQNAMQCYAPCEKCAESLS
jgi:hypothetical protein